MRNRLVARGEAEREISCSHVCDKINKKYNMDDEETLVALGFIILKRRERRKKARKSRKMWVREIYKQRENLGIFHTLVQEMALGDRQFYFK